MICAALANTGATALPRTSEGLPVSQRIPLLFLALCIGLAALAAPATTAADSAANVPGEILVRLRPGVTLSAARLMAHPTLGPRLAALGAWSAEPIGASAPVYRVRVAPGADLGAAARRLAADPAVAYAEPNHRRVLARAANDEIFPQQWALPAIAAPEAWDITTGGEIVVAVIDSGVDGSHPDLAGKVLPGFNVFSGGADAGDDNGHGTAVAGLIAANSDNSAGVTG